jgi:lipopolysaccharide transport system permease protein
LAIALLPFLGGRVGISLVSLPLLVVLITLPVIAIGLPLAAVNVYYRDFRYALPLVTQLWLFVSPVAYPLSRVPHGWRPLYAGLNPVVGMMEGFRRVLTLAQWPDWGLLGVSTASSVVLGYIAYRIFKRLEPQFSDVI